MPDAATPSNALQPPAPRTGLGRRVALLALCSTLLSTLVLSFVAYRAENRTMLRGVDDKLRALAVAIPAILPADYHRRLAAGEGTPAEHEALARRLSSLAADAGIYYVYTCVQRGDQILLSSSSATEKEFADGSWSRPLDVYKQPPPELVEVLKDRQPRPANYTDEFGSFRSIFLPARDSDPPFVIGADFQLDELAAMTRANLYFFLAVGAAVALVVGTAAVFAGQTLARPVRRLTTFVRSFTDGDFSNDEESLAELNTLSARDPTETGELAETFLFMRQALFEHFHNLQTATAGKERAESQLRIARDIQMGLLPETPPEIPGFDIAGWSEPADETGGDYYDWMQAQDGSLIFAVADATGHGLGPAMMAAVCRAYARAILGEKRPLNTLIDQLNRLVCTDSRSGSFVTLFVGRLDPRTSLLRILSAGHGPALHYIAKENRVDRMGSQGLPLGITELEALEEDIELALAPGDVLLIVSDGFFEWGNADGHQFGVDRLADAFRDSAHEPADVLIQSLRAAVAAFTGDTPQPDDMTAIAVRRL